MLGTEQLLINTDAGMAAFDPATGKELWAHEWPAPNVARVVQPTVVGTHDLLIGTGMGVGTRKIEISREGGDWQTKEQWTTCAIKPYYNDLVVFDDHLYGFDGSFLVCVSLKDGSGQWRERLRQRAADLDRRSRTAAYPFRKRRRGAGESPTGKTRRTLSIQSHRRQNVEPPGCIPWETVRAQRRKNRLLPTPDGGLMGLWRRLERNWTNQGQNNGGQPSIVNVPVPFVLFLPGCPSRSDGLDGKELPQGVEGIKDRQPGVWLTRSQLKSPGTIHDHNSGKP